MAEQFQQIVAWFAKEYPSSEFTQFGSVAWLGYAALILFGRGCDLGSTYLATPNLKLEGNPIARRLGWRGGVLLSLLAAVVFGTWPLIAISVTTTSMLVAGRNLHQAWIMRAMGEEAYLNWFYHQVLRSKKRVVWGCHWGEAILFGLPGVALTIWGDDTRVSLGVGLGLIVYGMVIAIFTSWMLWGMHRT